MTKEKGLSQSMAGNGNFTNTIVGFAGRDLNQTQVIQNIDQDTHVSTKDMIRLIEQMQYIIRHSNLPETPKSKCERHIQVFREEVEEQHPNKELAAHSLQKITHILKDTGVGMETGKNAPDNLQSVITRMLPWLGEAKKFLVL